MSLDFNTLRRDSKDNKFYFSDGTELDEMFPSEMWDCPEAFKMAGIRGYEPMTAKELETEEVQDEKINNLYEVGEITKEDIADCYKVECSEPYITLREIDEQ